MRIALAILAGLTTLAALGYALRVYLRARGTRLVQCPETHETVAVELDAAHATLRRMLGGSELNLRQCTRWPERAGCGQDCLGQIEAAPEECLVRTILARWYETKTCAVCGRAFGDLDWTLRKPALMQPDGATAEWCDLVPERIPEFLVTHKPVCFDCHVAVTLRRLHPELIVDRPARNSGGVNGS